MKALFGPKAVSPFEQIISTLNSIRTAAGMRYQMLYDGDDNLLLETRREFERTIFSSGTDDDDVSKKVKDAIAEMEAICIPIVRPANWRSELVSRYVPAGAW